MSATETLGILPLGRATFDVEFANQRLVQMLAAIEARGRKIVGPRALLLEPEETETAIGELAHAKIDRLLILQVTFTDAAIVGELAGRFDCPLAIWAVSEPRLGGRLRLNAFCGLNLASHALGLRERPFSYLYGEPGATDLPERLEALISGQPSLTAFPMIPAPGKARGAADPEGRRIADAISSKRIARIGEHPAGFDTCRYDAAEMHRLCGVNIDTFALNDLFGAAAKVDNEQVRGLRARTAELVDGLDDVDQPQLDRSLRLKGALEHLRGANGIDAFAIRCWPETFTQYGGAVCGPVSMMGEGGVPCACEADVYGALTQLVLQETAKAPVFLVDLVDLDAADNTGIVWHCGQAPISMADPQASAVATIHTNRAMPLLFQFTLKPGRVTFARISQARGEKKMVIGGGEMLAREMAFTGTSGVVRFDSPAETVLTRVIGANLEHHMAFAYGDHRAALHAVAQALDLPVLEL